MEAVARGVATGSKLLAKSGSRIIITRSLPLSVLTSSPNQGTTHNFSPVASLLSLRYDSIVANWIAKVSTRCLQTLIKETTEHENFDRGRERTGGFGPDSGAGSRRRGSDPAGSHFTRRGRDRVAS